MNTKVMIITLVLGLLIYALVYGCSSADCESRGGHTEIVYGPRAGWTCSGATR